MKNPTHHDLIKYLSKCVAIERNRLTGAKRLGKDTTEIEHDLACAEMVHRKLALQKVEYVQLAGVYANDRYFWAFASREFGIDFSELDEAQSREVAANFIRHHCEIISRKELKTNGEAQVKFLTLKERFKDWKRYKQTEAA